MMKRLVGLAMVLAMAVLASCPAAQAELVGYLDFNSSDGNTVTAQALVPLTGTLMGDAKLGAIDATRPLFLTGQYLELDGDGDYVDLGNPDALNFTTGDWAVSAWVKSTNAGTGDANKGTILGNGGDTGGGIRYGLIVSESADGPVTVVIDDNANPPGSTFNKKLANGATAVNDGPWHHVVGLREGGEIRVYVDGVLDGTGTYDASYDLTGIDQHNAYIGAITDHDDVAPSLYKFFAGSLDDVAVWDQALPDWYIGGLADGSLTPADPVPEPSTLALAAMALLGLAYVWRRRNR